MKLSNSQTNFLRWALRFGYLTPLIYWFYLGLVGGLGVQPLVTVNRQTGYVLLTLIIVNLWLSVFMKRKWLGPVWVRWIFSERRSMGIAAGFYVLLHFSSYWGREAFETKALIQIFERFYLTMGFFAMVIILAMAITSNDFSLRKLGFQRWKTLHRMIHVASFFILAHIFLIEKGNIPLMILLTFPLIPFQLSRLYAALVRKSKKT